MYRGWLNSQDWRERLIRLSRPLRRSAATTRRTRSRVEACDYVRYAASGLFAAFFFFLLLPPGRGPFSSVGYHEEDERAVASRPLAKSNILILARESNLWHTRLWKIWNPPKFHGTNFCIVCRSDRCVTSELYNRGVAKLLHNEFSKLRKICT